MCRPDVIHIVATLEPSTSIRGNLPWMLEVKDSCPGAKFDVSRQADTVLLTTDTLKVELSLKWGSIQFTEQRKRYPLTRADFNSPHL